MIPDGITFCNAKQASKRPSAIAFRLSQNVKMAAQPKEESVVALNEVAGRVAWLEQRMSESRTDFAARMGLSYGAYKNALPRGSFRMVNLIKLAKSLDVSLDFICALSNKPKPIRTSEIPATFWGKHITEE